MDENKEIRIGLGTFTAITLGLVLIVVAICGAIYLNHVAETNRDDNNKKHSTTNKVIVGSSNSMNNSLVNETRVNIDKVYAFTCKSVITGSQYESENTLVAIDKNNDEEVTIMNFNSGAYDYHNNKIYFYENTANSYHRFYMIDLEKNVEPQEIYSFEYRYAYTDNLEYYEDKLYYTFDGELCSLNLNDKQVQHITTVRNYIFYINNETDKLYYINEDETLCEMNLKTEETKVIDTNSGITYLGKDKLIYTKVIKVSEEEYESWYWAYDLNTGVQNKIAECWGGELGKSRIVRYDSKYWYLNGEGQLIILGDNDEMQRLTDEGNFNALTILPDNKILLERNEAMEGEDFKTYIYDVKQKQIISTNTNYRYSYTKNI